MVAFYFHVHAISPHKDKKYTLPFHAICLKDKLIRYSIENIRTEKRRQKNKDNYVQIGLTTQAIAEDWSIMIATFTSWHGTETLK